MNIECGLLIDAIAGATVEIELREKLSARGIAWLAVKDEMQRMMVDELLVVYEEIKIKRAGLIAASRSKSARR